MTRLVNADVSQFVSTAVEGYVIAHGDLVSAVPGGVTRATEIPEGHVAVVMGGGSGHFPAFAGWVGPGLANGGVCGEIFASPAENRISSVARESERGGGILLLPVNYAGDILNFNDSRDVLVSEGYDVRMVVVADDIASATSEHRHTRRGIAGSFVALKMIGAAAESGLGLDEVERIALAASDSVRTLGVAFSGCTVPGADQPLFTVPEARMAVGLGVHGEPGIEEVALGRADDIADVLFDRLIAERPAEPGRHVAILLNGLGTMEPDELHILMRRVFARVEQAGMVAVAPVTGQIMTSLDMAGVSLTFAYLDEELEEFWLAPARCAAFTRGEPSIVARRERKERIAPVQKELPPSSEESRRSATEIVRALVLVLLDLQREEARLGALDAVAGDGDHGAGMVRGARAALLAAESAALDGAGARSTLDRAGAAWQRDAGGTSGALWGAGLRAAAAELDDEAAVTPASLVLAVRAFASEIEGKGGAVVGDKTMIDAIAPFRSALDEYDGGDMSAAWRRAAGVASEAAAATSDFASRLGRSKLHGDRSIGTPDPGATSFALISASVLRIASPTAVQSPE